MSARDRVSARPRAKENGGGPEPCVTAMPRYSALAGLVLTLLVFVLTVMILHANPSDATLLLMAGIDAALLSVGIVVVLSQHRLWQILTMSMKRCTDVLRRVGLGTSRSPVVGGPAVSDHAAQLAFEHVLWALTHADVDIQVTLFRVHSLAGASVSGHGGE